MRTRNTVTAILMFVLVLSFTIGGTLAWLTDTTEPVTNTFTYGDINITLAETTEVYKMVPGNSISKGQSRNHQRQRGLLAVRQGRGIGKFQRLYDIYDCKRLDSVGRRERRVLP